MVAAPLTAMSGARGTRPMGHGRAKQEHRDGVQDTANSLRTKSKVAAWRDDDNGNARVGLGGDYARVMRGAVCVWDGSGACGLDIYGGGELGAHGKWRGWGGDEVLAAAESGAMTTRGRGWRR